MYPSCVPDKNTFIQGYEEDEFVLRQGSWKLSVMFVLLLVVLVGCSSGDKVETNEKGWPTTIRLGSLPLEDAQMGRGANQFADDLAAHLGIEVEVFEGEDYNTMIEAMRTGNIDLTTYGPFGYIIATERSGAKILAQMSTGPNSVGTSVFIVPKDSEVTTIADLKGKTFLFADPASTSGHLFPRATIMKQLGITNDEVLKFFSNVSFSGGHDKSVLAIANGDADGAAVCGQCIDMFAAAGLVNPEDVKIIGETDPIIGGGALAYRDGLPADLVTAIQEFAYGYGEVNPEYFESMGAKGFYPGQDSDYDGIREVAKMLDMSPEEMLSQ